jgi:hypothetical protein
MASRTLNFVNNSNVPGSFMVFQQLEGGYQLNSLAWFARYAYPNTTLRFDWDDAAYDFVWAASGNITPGIVINASQVVPANLSAGNQISFSYDAANRTFNLHNLSSGSPAGTLAVRQDSSIPMNAVAVGIGMSGAPTVVVQGSPNMTVTFTPRPTYWVAFGTFQQGQLLDIETITQPVQVVFPPNVVSMTATLNADNTFTISQNILSAKETE